MTTIESIMQNLRELPPSKLAEVARYVQGLHAAKGEEKRDALMSTEGCMKGLDGEDFARAVQAEADRIDADAK